jgi:hypothetical protein
VGGVSGGRIGVHSSLDELWSYLAGFTTDEARVLASAVVLIAAVIIGSVAIPLLVRAFRQSLSRRLVRGPVKTWASISRRHVP